MENFINFFKRYLSDDVYIMSIYENDEFYICLLNFKEYQGIGPNLPTVYYNKKTRQYKEVLLNEPNTIVADTKNSKLVYGKELFWEDDGLLDKDLDA